MHALHPWFTNSKLNIFNKYSHLEDGFLGRHIFLDFQCTVYTILYYPAVSEPVGW